MEVVKTVIHITVLAQPYGYLKLILSRVGAVSTE